MHEVTIYDCEHKKHEIWAKIPKCHGTGVARENPLCFKHEHGHVHAQEP